MLIPFSEAACILCLQSKFEDVVACLGTVCSSWIVVSRGSTKRNELTVAGSPEYASVRAGNLVTRTRGAF